MAFNQPAAIRLVLLSSLIALVTPPQNSEADLLCLKVKGSKVTSRQVTTAKCPKGFTKLADTTSFKGTSGSNGANGATGADGKLGVWGNGEDGDLTVDAGGGIDSRKQYRNITIPAGVTTGVKQGHTVRCTGTLTIDGTLFVNPSNAGGHISTVGTSHYVAASLAPEAGVGTPAGNSECGITGHLKDAGLNGGGIGPSTARLMTTVNLKTSGGAGGGTGGGYGGAGGGGIALRCKEGISITASGVISAPGGNGSGGAGGGGGGIVILVSKGQISHAGTIDVRGGDGGPSTTFSCQGGGGGGGFVHFISPSLSNTGTIQLSGGAIGSSLGNPTQDVHCGGGGGGGSYGNGGVGPYVNNDGGVNSCASAQVSFDGSALTTTVASGEVEGLLL